MASYNIVTSEHILDSFKKKSRHFRIDLGQSYSIDKSNGDKFLNDKDSFAYFYNTRYSTAIYKKGGIGDIKLYVDLDIQDDVLAFYWDEDEFIFNLDNKMINEKGLDFYLGSLLKRVHEIQKQKKEEQEAQKKEMKDPLQSQKVKIGDPNKVINSPGDVRYEDIVAYLDKKRSERFKV